jgi:predicted acetyltransferase
LPLIYERLRIEQPGAVSRSSSWWAHYLHDRVADRQGASTLHHAVHTDRDGVADGYLTYRIKGRWEIETPAFEVQVIELLAATPETYNELWRYVLEADLGQTIACHCGRTDEPLRHLLRDPRRLKVDAVCDDLYLRLLDIPLALSARTYAATGTVVLGVAETIPTAKTGHYLLSAEAGQAGATCHLTDRPADIMLHTTALATAYLGGETFTNLVRAGQAAAASPARLTEADAMFSWGIAPYCGTMF